MSIQDHIRELEERHKVEVYGRIPLGENGTWGVNVQFYRLSDGAFLEARPRTSFVFTREDIESLYDSGGVIKLEERRDGNGERQNLSHI